MRLPPISTPAGEDVVIEVNSNGGVDITGR
jgi:hypothetical protein